MFGRYHGKGAFIASININAKFTLGRKITGIFRLVHVHFKKENGDILGNTFMSSIGDRLKNICDGCFLGCTHEDKKQFIILPPHMAVLFHHQGQKQYAIQSGQMFLSLET